MAITRAQQYRQMLENGGRGISLQEAKDMAPKGEFLAYINKKEAKMLKNAGGSGIMTNAGIPSFIEYGSDDRGTFSQAASTGSVQGDVDRGGGKTDYGDPDPEVDVPTKNRKDTITSFTKNLSANIKSNPFSMLTPLGTLLKTGYQTNKAKSMLGLTNPTSNINNTERDGDGSQIVPLWAQLGFNSEAEYLASLTAQQETDTETKEDEGLRLAFRADGGRIGAMDGGMMSPEGGIMDLESGRQMYFLGKLVKKATRAVKKIAKSPIGKAALLYAGGAGLAGLGTGTSFMSNLMSPTSLFRNLAMSGKGFLTGISGGALQFPGAAVASNAPGAFKLGEFLRTPKGILTGITAASTIAGMLTPEQEEQAQLIADETGIDIAEIRANPDKYLARRFYADGGIMRLGYQEGSKEPVAKKTMPLLDMGGKEMDLREDGGFVPIGRMEKADDVPARLSKNEFVFTADAVRNAGDGNVDKGAEVMYNMMKNLESGGDVSEESQGLEGAREMFQTSQRLEEVL